MGEVLDSFANFLMLGGFDAFPLLILKVFYFIQKNIQIGPSEIDFLFGGKRIFKLIK